MKRLIFAVLAVLCFAVLAYAASGDKTTPYGVAIGTPANSTAAAKVTGEMKMSGTYLYLNVSTAARPHWRRIAVGTSF